MYRTVHTRQRYDLKEGAPVQVAFLGATVWSDQFRLITGLLGSEHSPWQLIDLLFLNTNSIGHVDDAPEISYAAGAWAPGALLHVLRGALWSWAP